MKHNTPELMKFKRLQRRLRESTRGVVGLLELMWLQTARNAPRGDIGKFSNEEIAIMTDWDADPDELVAALVDTGWLDPHNECRLVVHDWSEHAPNFVKGNVVRHSGGFIASPGDVPQGTLPKDVPQATLPPSQAKPSPTKPSLSAAACAAADVDIGEVVVQANKLRKAVPSLERDYVWQVCFVSEMLEHGMAPDLVSRIRQGGINRPKAYIDKAMRDECEKRGLDWSEVRKQVVQAKEPANA